MVNLFHEDIFFVECLARIYVSADQLQLSDIEIEFLLESKINAYIGEVLCTKTRDLAIKIFKLLCLRQDEIAINTIEQLLPTTFPNQKSSSIVSGLIRIAIRALLNNGNIMPCLPLIGKKIKVLTYQDAEVLIEDINSILKAEGTVRSEKELSHETLRFAIDINRTYINYILKLIGSPGDCHKKDLQLKYLSDIVEIINGKKYTYESLTVQPRLNKIIRRNNLYLINLKSAEKPEAHKIAICTHHKCGTVFFMRIIKAVSADLNLKVWRKYYEPERYTQDDWDIVFEQHSRIKNIIQPLRGIHCIRRPESLIYSATLYHQIAKEPWLDIPLEKFDHNTYRAFTTGRVYNLINDKRIDNWRKKEIALNFKCDDKTLFKFESEYEFNGRSYREMLNSFESFSDRLKFEMQCYSMGVISDILNFNDKNFYTLVEDASFNPQMNELYDAFKFIGFEGDKLNQCMKVCKQNVLIHNPEAPGNHGTTNLSNKWKEVFKGKLNLFYRSLYADSAYLLGYQ